MSRERFSVGKHNYRNPSRGPFRSKIENKGPSKALAELLQKKRREREGDSIGRRSNQLLCDNTPVVRSLSKPVAQQLVPRHPPP